MNSGGYSDDFYLDSKNIKTNIPEKIIQADTNSMVKAVHSHSNIQVRR